MNQIAFYETGMTDSYIQKFTLNSFKSQLNEIKQIDDIQVQLTIFYKLILDRLQSTGMELNKDMKEMVGLILAEVQDKEEKNKNEGIDFFEDLIDPQNEEFVSYFQIKEDNDVGEEIMDE